MLKRRWIWSDICLFNSARDGNELLDIRANTVQASKILSRAGGFPRYMVFSIFVLDPILSSNWDIFNYKWLVANAGGKMISCGKCSGCRLDMEC